jgi:hypothetical protein
VVEVVVVASGLGRGPSVVLEAVLVADPPPQALSAKTKDVMSTGASRLDLDQGCEERCRGTVVYLFCQHAMWPAEVLARGSIGVGRYL